MKNNRTIVILAACVIGYVVANVPGALIATGLVMLLEKES